jgi:hypothetical protein
VKWWSTKTLARAFFYWAARGRGHAPNLRKPQSHRKIFRLLAKKVLDTAIPKCYNDYRKGDKTNDQKATERTE